MDLEFYARYYLEHKALPNALYNEGPRLLNSFMLDGGKAMHSFYDRVTAANPSYCCPYSENDFYVNYRVYIRDNDSCMVLRVQMPTLEHPLLCRAVYLCYGTRGGYELYVTSERMEDGSYCICSWDECGQHHNWGDAPADPNAEMDMAADLFWRSIKYATKSKSEGLCCS